MRLGDRQEAALCYDTQLYRVSAAWTGGFVQIFPARYGLITPQRPAGDMQFTSPTAPGWTLGAEFVDRRAHPPFGPLPREQVTYRGFHRHGDRLVMEYVVGGTRVLESPWFEQRENVPLFTRALQLAPSTSPIGLLVCGPDGQASVRSNQDAVKLEDRPGLGTVLLIPPLDRVRLVQLAITARAGPAGAATVAAELVRWAQAGPPEEPERWVPPGPPRWTAAITTRGVRAPNDAAYVVDTLTLPFDNPYRALFFVGGHDFLPNGDLVLCTVHGDVWRVRGVDEQLEKLDWQRMATGLFQPLGLRVVKGQIYVVGRDQITRLHDQNDDGEIDFYENFNNEGQVTMNAHEYVTCLEVDAQGSFYYLKGNSNGETLHDGALLRVPPDGSRLEVFATGFRNANGLGIGPDGTITVAPQEGEWTPASAVFTVRRGGFYGFTPSSHLVPPPPTMEPPLCWFSRRQDNSSGGQVWVTSANWGPLSRQLLHLSYGQCRVYPVLREQIGERFQGASYGLPLQFDSGIMRGRFRERDQSLYLSGLLGWVSNARADGCLQRVRYTGKPLPLPVRIASYANGVAVTFAEPLERESAEDTGNYQVQRWNYQWSAKYGSPEYKVSQPNVEGRDDVELDSATLLDDDRTVFLEMDPLRPCNLLSLQYQLRSATGAELANTLNYTLHEIAHGAFDSARLRRRAPGEGIDAKSLRRGLIVEFRQRADAKARRDRAVSRTAAIWFAPTEAASSGVTRHPVEATYSGYLRVPLNGDYQFALEGQGAGSLKVAGEEWLRYAELPAKARFADAPGAGATRTIRLRKGWIPIEIEYQSPAAGGGEFRLGWKPGGQAAEPVPPELLGHRADEPASLAVDQLRAGLNAFSDHRCLQCHTLPTASPNLTSELADPRSAAPNLSRAATDYQEAWLRAWMLSPRALREDAHMPGLLGDPRSAQAVQEAADLVAFLLSSHPARAARANAELAAEGDAGRGLELYESLGCIACHRFDSNRSGGGSDIGEGQGPPLTPRVSLEYAAAKFRPGAMARYLRQPSSHYPGTTMPDFRLTAQEAADLESYVRVHSRAELDMPDQQGSLERGRELFAQRQCQRCHALHERPIESAARLPLRPQRSQTGCLAPAAAAGAPRWSFQESERAVLSQFCAQLPQWVASEPAWQRTPRLLAKLRCGACHPRDGLGADWPQRLLHDSELGLPPENIPQLTWTGEKLWPDWMQRLLAGEAVERPRPWLKARMPAFPAWAEQLAQGLSAEHGHPPTARLAFADSANTPGAAERIEIGNRLTFKNGGLDCRQCHAVGEHQPIGDQTTNLALGINFVQVQQRLRHDYYRRFVLDPPRYDPTTRMPKLASDGVLTNLRSVFDGDAEQQFEAIWEFIQALDARGNPRSLVLTGREK